VLSERGDYMGARRWINIVSSGGAGSGSPAADARKEVAARQAAAARKAGLAQAAHAGGAPVTGVQAALNLFHQAESGVRMQPSNIKGIGKLPMPFKPTMADWQKVKAILIRKLRAALVKLAALQRAQAAEQRKPARVRNRSFLTAIAARIKSWMTIVAELRQAPRRHDHRDAGSREGVRDRRA
jgi:hypothetical protein